MAGYEDQADDGYYLDEPAGSFEQDLVYALEAGVRHTVNQALAQAIKHIKHHLLGFAVQQGWVAPSGIQSIMEPSLSAGTQATKQIHNPHSADFESLFRNMAWEHDYNSASQKKAKSDPASSSSSDHSSEQGDDPPRKRKTKTHHQEAPTPRIHGIKMPYKYGQEQRRTRETGRARTRLKSRSNIRVWVNYINRERTHILRSGQRHLGEQWEK
ncbi:hypothetical protein NDU88_004036 [Pleurodeles waltl]|uniref:Uncharacterized protein n=1 Tax=Pleurodeles waltl TaxID=8319 RepID=A0AAV7WSW8_PLEWA|nr:hypothetical protein NDU88_004036 [Pleurodeles waltl]